MRFLERVWDYDFDPHANVVGEWTVFTVAGLS